MRAARLHGRGEPMRIDRVPTPEPRPSEVLVEVHACGIVPNVKNVLQYGDDFIAVQPPKPAIFGLDVAGVIVAKGELVHGFAVGDRVYVNPARYCGTCHYCARGEQMACESFTLNGYFGVAPRSAEMFRDYPYGGYAEYMVAPGYSLVRMAKGMDFALAARWGYLGTSYGALRRARLGPVDTLLVNGASGTLGLGAVLFGLAMTAGPILATGRDQALLERVKAIAPERIEVFSAVTEAGLEDWVRSRTGGYGAEVVIDALPPGAPVSAFEAGINSLAKFGRHVNCGGILERASFDTPRIMITSQTLMGSMWFTTAQAHEMMDLIRLGRVDLDVLEHERFALEDIEQALERINWRRGGFSNLVIAPRLAGAE